MPSIPKAGSAAPATPETWPLRELRPLRERLAGWGGWRWGACLAWALLCYGLELFRFNWTIDEELVAFASAPNQQWVAQGRWAMYLWNALVSPDGLVPLLPQAIALACLVTSAALIGSWLAPAGGSRALLFALLFVAHPVHALLLGFSTAQYGLFFGLLLATAGTILLVESSGVRSMATAAALLTFALGTYQPLASLIIALLVGWIVVTLAEASGDGPAVRGGLLAVGRRAIVVGGAALAAHALIDLAAKSLVRARSNYRDSDLGALLNLDNFDDRVHWFVRGLRVYYRDGVGLEDRFVLRLYILLLAAAILFLATRPVGAGRRIAAVAAIGALLASPFALELAFGMVIPERSHVAIPVAVAVVAGLALRLGAGRTRAILLVCVAAAAFRMAVVDNKLIFAGQLSEQADRDEIHRIVRAVEALDGLESLPRPVPLTFVGGLRRPPDNLFRQVDVVGGSFLGWDGGNPWRIAAFMKVMGISGYRGIGRGEWERLKSRARSEGMPAWPAEGAVRILDGVVVVNLGES